MMSLLRLAWAAVLSFTVGASVLAADTDPSSSDMPPFSEVLENVRTNLTGLSDLELNRDAVVGLLSQLQPRVMLLTNQTAPAGTNGIPLVSKATTLDGSYAFVRIGQVAPNLSQEVGSSLDRLSKTNQLKGLVLDLRFAVGTDYRAAAETADLFFGGDQVLLEWTEGQLRSTPKAHAIDLPLVVLVNHETAGASEALAAALRQADGALLIGSATAGKAYVYKDVTLSNGQVLRIASGRIATGRGDKLSEKGLTPDIVIAVNAEDARAYFEDPYKVLPRPFAQAARPDTSDNPLAQATGRPRRPRNEAELVRMQREGADFDAEPLPQPPTQPSGPVVMDPALSRALDLLKGLSIASKRR